jgi:ABC-type branched-subunit amino acid transport system substrate-binding protein
MKRLTMIALLGMAVASCAGSGPRTVRGASGTAPGPTVAAADQPVASDLPAGSGAPGVVSSARPRVSSKPGKVAATTKPGAAAAPAPLGAGDTTGVTATSVLFGMHLPQSGAVGALVGNDWHGADAYFKYVNDTQGGVFGRRINFVVSDDGYDAAKAAQAIRDLVDTKKVFAASCLAGVDQCVVGVTYANTKGVPYIHAGMSEAAVADKLWAFPTTTTYPYGVEKMIDYLVTKRGFTNKKWGAFYLNSDQITKDMLPKAVSALDKYRLKFVDKEPAEKDQNDFSASITKMQNAGVDVVWFHVDPTLIAKFTAQAQALRFKPTYVFTSPAGGDLYATAAGGGLDGGIGVTAIADPNWAGAADFVKVFNKYYPNESPDEFNILAYADAMVFVEGLKRAGKDLGRDSFARGLAAVDSFNTGISSPISYTARGRVASANSQVAIEEIHGTSTDQKTGFEF